MELQDAAQQTGYTANMVEVNIQEQIVEALSQLYAATEEDSRSAMLNLMATNLNLTEQVANLITKLSAKDDKIKALECSLDELTATMQAFSMASMMQQLGNPNMM
eukprot:13094313-Ditylum_brightwellii.AAC.1